MVVAVHTCLHLQQFCVIVASGIPTHFFAGDKPNYGMLRPYGEIFHSQLRSCSSVVAFMAFAFMASGGVGDFFLQGLPALVEAKTLLGTAGLLLNWSTWLHGTGETYAPGRADNLPSPGNA